jgi:hypothetical protein
MDVAGSSLGLTIKLLHLHFPGRTHKTIIRIAGIRTRDFPEYGAGMLETLPRLFILAVSNYGRHVLTF